MISTIQSSPVCGILPVVLVVSKFPVVEVGLLFPPILVLVEPVFLLPLLIFKFVLPFTPELLLSLFVFVLLLLFVFVFVLELLLFVLVFVFVLLLFGFIVFSRLFCISNEFAEHPFGVLAKDSIKDTNQCI